MVWPPIRYSYRTVNNEIPEAAPAKPSWLYDRKTRCQRYPLGVDDPNCTHRQLELARHRRPGARRARPPHLRLPHLGAVRPDPDDRLARSSASRPAPCRAISAAGSTSSSSASSRSGRRSRCSICCSSSPPSCRPASSSCSASCCCSPGSRLSASCAPSSCARATSNTSTRRARSASPTARSCSGTCCRTRWWRR